MLSARVHEPGSIEVIDTEPAPLRPGAVRLKLATAGICGTDLAVIAGTTSLARYPLTLGHECVGQIEVAPPDSRLQSGDWAVVFPTVSCGACQACWTGRENRCADMRVMGISDPHGCFAETVEVPPSQLIPVDAATARSHGSLIEPLAVACHVAERAELRDGDRVLIIGSGVIGLSCAVVARALGAARVVLVDRLDRHDAVRALGFEEFIQIDDATSPRQIIEPQSIDVVIDAVMTTQTASVSLEALDRGGRYATVATPKQQHVLDLPYGTIYERELQLVAARNYTRGDFGRALRLLQHGAADLRPLVTATYPLVALPEALAELRARPEQHLKIQLTS
jgi:2-desacetyl-2-hydroxyethyl bacteriochlorophyllide A dehydrogenase